MTSQAPTSVRLADLQETKEARVLGEGPSETATLVDTIAVKPFDEGDTALNRTDSPRVAPIARSWRATASTPCQISAKCAVNGSLRVALDKAASGAPPSFMDETGVAVIVCGIVVGMKRIHSRGAIRGNLRPADILLDGDGFARIDDVSSGQFAELGIARASPLAFPYYSAPEMYDDDGVTNAVDVFAFALILYELLVGHYIFRLPMSEMSVMKKIVTGVRPELPAPMDATVKDIISRCWSVDPSSRFSFDEIYERLDRIHFKLTPGVECARVSAFLTMIGEGKGPLPLSPVSSTQTETIDIIRFSGRVNEYDRRFRHYSRFHQLTRDLPDKSHLQEIVSVDTEQKIVNVRFYGGHVSIAEAIRRNIPINAAALFEALSSTVQRLHRINVAHGDLSLGNVLMKDEDFVIIDYDQMKELQRTDLYNEYGDMNVMFIMKDICELLTIMCAVVPSRTTVLNELMKVYEHLNAQYVSKLRITFFNDCLNKNYVERCLSYYDFARKHLLYRRFVSVADLIEHEMDILNYAMGSTESETSCEFNAMHLVHPDSLKGRLTADRTVNSHGMTLLAAADPSVSSRTA